MILFHVPAIDAGDLSLWRRVLAPVGLLRQAGAQVRIVVGDAGGKAFSGANTIVFAGAIGNDTRELCRRAQAAGLRILLDIADGNALATDADSVREIGRAANLVTIGSEYMAAIAATELGPQIRLTVIGDAHPIGGALGCALRASPAIGLRLACQVIGIRAIDAVRRLRRRLLGDRPNRRAGGPCVVWFGNGVALNQPGGLGELLLAAGDLVDLGQDIPFRLRVVGASRRSFRHTVGRLPIAAEFRRFTVPTLVHDLRDADLCFLPGGGDIASRSQSSARAQTAHHLGLPVLTVARADLEETQPGLMLTTEWRSALRSKIAIHAGSERAPFYTAKQPVIKAWCDALANDTHTASAHAWVVDKPRRRRVTFLLQQFQDLDLICPVAEAASASGDLDVRVAVLTKIAVPASRRLRVLREHGAEIVFWRGRDLMTGAIKLGSVEVALTASDGAGPGARHAAAFVRAANAAGAATLNLQHGLDNTGLTYGPSPRQKTPFSARFVLTWGGFERLTEAADAETRAKAIPVGCPKRCLTRADVSDFPMAGQAFIAVFENLHWRRYDEKYRQRFVRDLIAAAAAAPDIAFVLKPHMGGRWFSKEQTGRPLPHNLLLADPDVAEWRRFTSDSVLAHAAGVITTPSTIALDAARYDLPTALVGYGLPADNYAPLFRIEEASDWTDFVQQVRTGSHDMTKIRQFHDLSVIPGDAVTRILHVMRLAAADRSQAQILAAVAQESRTAPA